MPIAVPAHELNVLALDTSTAPFLQADYRTDRDLTRGLLRDPQLRTSARLFDPCRRGPYRDRLPR